ncbi:MAG TPA: hypothetical protein VFH88_10610 [Candidatus Krumholzibacteria bacterium]|nr:hypothetical protein [Candidatus Krumholzibacteria bacterium]
MSHCKRVVAAAVVLCGLCVLLASPAHANGGAMFLATEADGGVCDFVVPGPALVYVYLVHQLAPGDGVTASRFRVQPPATWAFLSINTTLPYIGSPDSDLSIDYTVCQQSSFTIGYLLYFETGATASCTDMYVLPSVVETNLLALDCSYQQIPMLGYGAVINPTGDCCCNCIAAHETTWGQVKALYR